MNTDLKIGKFLEIFKSFRNNPAPAYFHIDGDLSYAALYVSASILSRILAKNAVSSYASPVIIYGHKDCRYPIAYWACILAGRPIIPVEPDFPIAHVQRICKDSGASLLLDATPSGSAPTCLKIEMLHVIIEKSSLNAPTPEITGISAENTMYLMFSSGTSGQPKGIKISYGNVIDFLDWLETILVDFGPIQTITGNVRFCFDVSLFEFWTSWLLNKPMSVLDHTEFFNSRKYIRRFRQHQVTTWISTPTMIRRYLADPCFRSSELPSLNTFLFCGEVLPKEVVVELWHRFDGCRVFNTYGPTECTVAVTSVRILPSHVNAASLLPIGYVRPRTDLYLDIQQSNQTRGEIIIRGASVGLGYLNLPRKQAYSFPYPNTYRTGDYGRVDQEGLWYFEGRTDREYKIQGVRIDLNDIETYIRQLPDVIDAVADVYYLKGEPRGINVFVIGPRSALQLGSLAHKMAQEFPPYFIPRFWYGAIDAALNFNGNLERSKIVKDAIQRNVRFVYKPS